MENDFTGIDYDLFDSFDYGTGNRKKRRCWKTRDGEVIAIENLDDGHLDNIISLLERRKGDEFWLEIMKSEKERRRKNAG